VGTIYVDMEVSRNSRDWETVRFLVDSGVSYSVIRPHTWRKLRLRPARTLEFALADGTTMRRRLSECRFRYRGLDVASPVVLGESNDAALLGTVTLEILGLVLNPFDRTLRPMRLTLAATPVRAGYAPALSG
jgi:predicted aspartyl protease